MIINIFAVQNCHLFSSLVIPTSESTASGQNIQQVFFFSQIAAIRITSSHFCTEFTSKLRAKVLKANEREIKQMDSPKAGWPVEPWLILDQSIHELTEF